MQAKTSGGSIVTITESGILLEKSGHFGINKNNSDFIGELKARIAPYQGGTVVIQPQQPVQQSVVREVTT